MSKKKKNKASKQQLKKIRIFKEKLISAYKSGSWRISERMAKPMQINILNDDKSIKRTINYVENPRLESDKINNG